MNIYEKADKIATMLRERLKATISVNIDAEYVTFTCEFKEFDTGVTTVESIRKDEKDLWDVYNERYIANALVEKIIGGIVEKYLLVTDEYKYWKEYRGY